MKLFRLTNDSQHFLKSSYTHFSRKIVEELTAVELSDEFLPMHESIDILSDDSNSKGNIDI